MTFRAIILRSLWRRPVRTTLTLLGVAVGIAAVVALVGFAQGFERSWARGMEARGTDIVVSNMASMLTPTPFDASSRDRVAALPQVANTGALLVQMMGVENAEMILVSSREWGGYGWENLRLLEGRLPNDAREPAVVLGQTAAEVLGKKPGDSLLLETRELTVVGIVDGGALVENGSIILSLPLLQEITGNEGRINVIDVRAKPGTSDADLRALATAINELIPEARAIPAREHISNSQAFRFIRAMSWATSLLAVLAGVLGVMNTMLMAVLERQREFSILLALGWRPGRLMQMVLWESAIIGVLGGVAGVLLGIAATRLLESAPAVRGLLAAEISPELALTAVGIAFVVGLVSGLYPAWRSAHLPPNLALQSGG